MKQFSSGINKNLKILNAVACSNFKIHFPEASVIDGTEIACPFAKGVKINEPYVNYLPMDLFRGGNATSPFRNGTILRHSRRDSLKNDIHCWHDKPGGSLLRFGGADKFEGFGTYDCPSHIAVNSKIW